MRLHIESFHSLRFGFYHSDLYVSWLTLQISASSYHYKTFTHDYSHDLDSGGSMVGNQMQEMNALRLNHLPPTLLPSKMWRALGRIATNSFVVNMKTALLLILRYYDCFVCDAVS